MDGMAGMCIWMLISGLFGLAILALIVVGVVWLVRSLSGSRPDAGEQELRRRFAAGEIDDEEFRRRREELRRP
ncbi:SHOCT domain-containing protein [Micromonospora rhizosphaerae]|nr:SHOCT domain-containing protein [Micromonospora rhizosphaerae]